MDLSCEERASDSPFVESVWHSRSEAAGTFISVAATRYGMVISKYKNKVVLTVRGPETMATPAYCPPDTEFIGIQFKAGVFMPMIPASKVMNRRDINLPEASCQSFWLNGTNWQFPTFENADTFVNRLIHENLLVYEPLVDEVLQGREPVGMSLRTVQRRFLQATGLTQTGFFQIERARHATNLLKQKRSILDTAYEVGYFDQPHLTRSLKRYMGLTPAQIMDLGRAERMSFLYKTTPMYTQYNMNVR